MSNRITMSDVAQQAGVSLMTVSRVINQKGEVSPETRQRILDIIEDLGYRPSGIARSLATQRTGTLGLIVPDIANPYFSGMAQGVAEYAYEENFSVLLCDCNEVMERELEMLQVLDQKRVDGVILAAPRTSGAMLAPYLGAFEYAVVINRQFSEQNQSKVAGYVINDDESGSRKVIEMLLSHGHKTVGILAGPQASYGSKRRMLGYQDALARAGIDYIPELVLFCSPTVKGGHKAALQIIQQNPGLTGLFCYNDLVAIGALQACAELGIQVPKDLAIAGFDDIPMASWVYPQLTTCHVDFEEMGRLATQILISYLKHCPDGCENIMLQPEVVIRSSAP